MAATGDAASVYLDVSVLSFSAGHGEQTQARAVVNRSQRPCAFKLKTTSPKRYSVRPPVGWVRAGGEQQLRITFSPEKDFSPDKPDRFQLEVRTLNNTEVQALELDAKAQRDDAFRLLSARNVQSGDSVVRWLWKNTGEATVRRTLLQCTFNGAAAPAASDRRAQRGDEPLQTVRERSMARSTGPQSPTPSQYAGTRPRSQYSSATKEQLQEDVTKLKAAAETVQSRTAALRRRLGRGTRVPLWLATVLLSFAVVLGYVVNDEIDALAATPPFRAAARAASHLTGEPLLPD